MICIKCENEVFAEKPNALIEQEFRGEQLQVKTTATACTKCGWVTVTLKQTDELRRNTADAYRQKHELLTGIQIRAIRKLLEMSQREFAAFLGVGEASVKRWETWLVQEKSSDQLIRMKCEKEIRQLLTGDIECEYASGPQTTYWEMEGIVSQFTEKFEASRWANQAAATCLATAANEELALAA